MFFHIVFTLTSVDANTVLPTVFEELYRSADTQKAMQLQEKFTAMCNQEEVVQTLEEQCSTLDQLYEQCANGARGCESVLDGSFEEQCQQLPQVKEQMESIIPHCPLLDEDPALFFAQISLAQQSIPDMTGPNLWVVLFFTILFAVLLKLLQPLKEFAQTMSGAVGGTGVLLLVMYAVVLFVPVDGTPMVDAMLTSTQPELGVLLLSILTIIVLETTTTALLVAAIACTVVGYGVRLYLVFHD